MCEPITLRGLRAKAEFVAQKMREAYTEKDNVHLDGVAELPKNVADITGRFNSGDPA